MLNKTKISLLILIFSIIFTIGVKAWVEPVDTENIVSPLNSGLTGQSKLGSLILNLGGAVYGLIVDQGFVGIGTQSPKGVLDVSSTTSAFLPPRMTIAQRDAISSPQFGMMIANTDTKKINMYNGSSWELVGGDSTPAGTIAYFDLTACPSGWSDVPGAKGRYLVGTQNATNKNLTVGQALSDGENRAVGLHNHGVSDPGHAHGVWDPGHAHGVYDPGHAHQSYSYLPSWVPNHPQGWSLGVPSGPLDGWAWYGTTPSGTGIGIYGSGTGIGIYGSGTGISIINSGSVAGTNAPYIEFLVCRKN